MCVHGVHSCMCAHTHSHVEMWRTLGILFYHSLPCSLLSLIEPRARLDSPCYSPRVIDNLYHNFFFFLNVGTGDLNVGLSAWSRKYSYSLDHLLTPRGESKHSYNWNHRYWQGATSDEAGWVGPVKSWPCWTIGWGKQCCLLEPSFFQKVHVYIHILDI